MVTDARMISVLGPLGLYPLTRVSLPARRLLALLAIRGNEVERQSVADTLWPEIPEETGRANLRRSLWQVPRGWVSAIGDILVLDAECDLPRARDTAIRAIEGGVVTFDEIDLLSSDVLPGWHDDWATEAFVEFRILRVQGLEAACRTLLDHGNFPLAIQAGSAAVAAEPLRESATEALIEVHLAQHNRYEAVRCYNQLAHLLEEDLGVAPMPSLTLRLSDAGLIHRVA